MLRFPSMSNLVALKTVPLRGVSYAPEEHTKLVVLDQTAYETKLMVIFDDEFDLTVSNELLVVPSDECMAAEPVRRKGRPKGSKNKK